MKKTIITTVVFVGIMTIALVTGVIFIQTQLLRSHNISLPGTMVTNKTTDSTQSATSPGAMTGSGTVKLAVNYNARALTQEEINSLRFTLFTSTCTWGINLDECTVYYAKNESFNPSKTFSVPAGTNYQAFLEPASLPASLKDDVSENPYSPSSFPTTFAVEAGETKTVTMRIYLMPWHGDDGYYPTEPDSVTDERDDFGTFSFTHLLEDYSEQYGQTSQKNNYFANPQASTASTDIVEINNESYLVSARSLHDLYTTSFLTLNVFDLQDPANPAEIVSFDIQDALLSQFSHVADIDKYACEASSLDTVVHNETAYGFVKGNCFQKLPVRNAVLHYEMYFTFDPGLKSIEPVQWLKKINAEKGTTINADIFFVQNDTVYVTGDASVYSFNEIVATEGTVSPISTASELIGSIIDKYEVGIHWNMSWAVSGFLPKGFKTPMFASGVYYNDAVPYLVYNVGEDSVKEKNYASRWIAVIKYADIYNPELVYYAADDIAFTKQNCTNDPASMPTANSDNESTECPRGTGYCEANEAIEEGCDRTFFERIKFILRGVSPVNYTGDDSRKNKKFVDESTGNIYLAYYLNRQGSLGDQVGAAYETTHDIDGDYNDRKQFGILSIADPENIKRIAQPIISSVFVSNQQGSQKGLIRVPYYLFSGISNGSEAGTLAYSVNNNIVAFEDSHVDDVNCLLERYENTSLTRGDGQGVNGTCKITDEMQKHSLHFGFLDTQGNFAWIKDLSGQNSAFRETIAAPDAPSLSRDIEVFQKDERTYYVYISKEYYTIVYEITLLRDPAEIDLTPTGQTLKSGVSCNGTMKFSFDFLDEAKTCTCSAKNGDECACTCTE